MKSYLKIKIKSLAEEARIIRMEERRVKGRRKWVMDRQGDENRIRELSYEYDGLRNHRVHEVRDEARAAQLAYGFIRGRPYSTIENSCLQFETNLGVRVTDLAMKYGGMGTKAKRDEAKGRVSAWLKGNEYEPAPAPVVAAAPSGGLLGAVRRMVTG